MPWYQVTIDFGQQNGVVKKFFYEDQDGVGKTAVREELEACMESGRTVKMLSLVYGFVSVNMLVAQWFALKKMDEDFEPGQPEEKS